MNRIAGIFNLDHTPAHASEISRMLESMDQPGRVRHQPGIWVEGQVGLGSVGVGILANRHHHRASSPLRDQPFVIVFDGRLDNREELAAIIRPAATGESKPISDADLVLAAYQKWGLECAGRLIGDFAFALWDKERHQLFCSRDHFGVKPFTYFLSSRVFVFASDMLALFASGKVPRIIHDEGIADYLVDPLEGIDKMGSLYQGVFRLPPAHRLLISQQGSSLMRYWDLRSSDWNKPRTENEQLEQFRSLLMGAVRRRLGDAPTAASMLSGGLDSSAVVGMGQAILAGEGASLQTLAVVWKSEHANRESTHIGAVVRQQHLATRLISESDIMSRMDDLVDAIEDETDPSDCLMNLNRSVYLHAQEDGCGAVLDGVDGDILLTDSGHIPQLWRIGPWKAIPGETWRADGLTAEYKLGRRLLYESLLSVIASFSPDWLRRMRRRRRFRRLARSAVRDTIIDPDLAVRSRLNERFASLHSHTLAPPASAQEHIHRMALDHPLLTAGLERYQRVAAAFCIEARHPLLDLNLVEFCVGLPWYLKTHRGWTKMILRRALESDLPPEVIWRRDKDSLMWEVNRLILKERSDYFHQMTLDEKAALEPYVNIPKLMGFWDDYRQRGDETNAESLWSGVALAMWLRLQRA